MNTELIVLYVFAALAAGMAICWLTDTAAGLLHERLSASSVLLLMLASPLTVIATAWLAYQGLTRFTAG